MKTWSYRQEVFFNCLILYRNTVWSVNEGVSGNLRKPLGPAYVYITKNQQETCRKPVGNLPETSAQVSRGFRTIRQ